MDTKISQTKTIELFSDEPEKTTQTVSESTAKKNYVPEEFFVKFEALETEIDETTFNEEIKVTFSKNSTFELLKNEDPFKHKNELSEKFKSATNVGRPSRGSGSYRGRYRGRNRGNRGYRGRNRGNRGRNRGNRGYRNRGSYRGRNRSQSSEFHSGNRSQSSGYAKQVNRFEYLSRKVSAN